MNFFNLDQDSQIDLTNNIFEDSFRESFDDSYLMVQEERTKENQSETDSISKPVSIAAKAPNMPAKKVKKKKLTKVEREINKREKDRQRAKRNRDRKKQQFQSMQGELDAAFQTVRDREQRIRELEAKVAQLENIVNNQREETLFE